MHSAGTLRRRLHHEDVGGWKNERESSSAHDGLSEPLLGHHGHDDNDDDDNNNNGRREEQAWAHNLSKLLAEWAQWFSTVVLAGSIHLFAAVLGRQPEHHHPLSPLQEARLANLQRRLGVAFDGSLPDHQEALRELWAASYPSRPVPPLVSPQWKEMGWQGTDPATDFRGGGFVSLENLLFFARRFPAVFQRLLRKEQGERAEWEYPFAVAGLNVTFMLIQLLDLRAAKPGSGAAAVAFFNILATDEHAFDMLYCVAFQMLDQQWLALRASYMEFNAVLKATRAQLEKELALEGVVRVQDLPSYISLVNSS